ncbi:MAG: O-antigen ligase family protein, partial [archaeon]
YLLPHVFLALYFLFNFFREDNDFFGAINKKSYGVILVSLTLVLNVAGIFRTETRGDILGLMVGLLMILGFFAFRPPRFKVNFFKSRYVYLFVFLLIVFLGFVFLATKSNSFWSRVPGLNRFQNVSFSSQELVPRLSAISAAWQGFKEKPILGWGYENFNLPFNKHYDPKTLELGYQETRFDKTHNLFLEYLVTGGAVLFLAFIFLVVVLFYGAFKLSDKLLGQMIAAALIAYLARSFFVFDTLGPLLIFYLLIGFIGGNLKDIEIQGLNNNQQKLEKSNNNDKGVIMVSGAMLISLFLVYVLNINVMRAGYYQYLGFTSFVKSKPKLAIESFKKGIEVWTPYAWDFKRDYAAVVAENYFYGRLGVLGSVAQDEVWLAIKA